MINGLTGNVFQIWFPVIQKASSAKITKKELIKLNEKINPVLFDWIYFF
jgi:hypothetical protein